MPPSFPNAIGIIMQPSVEESSSLQEDPTIVRLTLYPSQAEQFQPLLADAFHSTGGIHGVLCTINRCQDLNAGHLFLELQAARLDGSTTRKIQQLILDSRFLAGQRIHDRQAQNQKLASRVQDLETGKMVPFSEKGSERPHR